MIFLFFRAFWHGFVLAAFVIWHFVAHLECSAKCYKINLRKGTEEEV